MFMVEIASPGSVIRPTSHSHSGSYGTAARIQEGRAGSDACLHPQRELWPEVSPEMPSLRVCNTNAHTLSTTWPPASDGSHPVRDATRFIKVQVLAGTWAAREQSQDCLILTHTPFPTLQRSGSWPPSTLLDRATQSPQSLGYPNRGGHPLRSSRQHVEPGNALQAETTVAPHCHVTPCCDVRPEFMEAGRIDGSAVKSIQVLQRA